MIVFNDKTGPQTGGATASPTPLLPAVLVPWCSIYARGSPLCLKGYGSGGFSIEEREEDPTSKAIPSCVVAAKRRKFARERRACKGFQLPRLEDND